MEGPVAEAYVTAMTLALAANVTFENGVKETAIAISKEAPVYWKNSIPPLKLSLVMIF